METTHTANTPRRGRPASGRALPPKERMRALRQRAVRVVQEGSVLDAIPDTGLFEALRVSYHQGRILDAADVCLELIRRMNGRVITGPHVITHFRVI